MAILINIYDIPGPSNVQEFLVDMVVAHFFLKRLEKMVVYQNDQFWMIHENSKIMLTIVPWAMFFLEIYG